jgi:transposase-like protein
MKTIKPYPKKERERVIRDYLQSGLTTYKYSNRSEVAVSTSTLNRWVEKHSQVVGTDLLETEEANRTEQLGMVCYTFDESNPTADHQIADERKLTLEEVFLFHKEVYECSCILQQLTCTTKNVVKVKHLLEVM